MELCPGLQHGLDFALSATGPQHGTVEPWDGLKGP